jgi:predicted transcriptional regulator
MTLNNLITNCVESGNATNEEMVECIQLLSDYLCLTTPKEYAKSKGIKFQSVYKGKKPITILGRKFVIDNQ